MHLPSIRLSRRDGGSLGHALADGLQLCETAAALPAQTRSCWAHPVGATCPSPPAASMAPSAQGWAHPWQLVPPTWLQLVHPQPSQSMILLFFFFFFFHRVQMGIKLRPLNSFALAAVMGLQAAFHHSLFTAAACLWLEHHSVLTPAAGAQRAAACSPWARVPAAWVGKQGWG